MIQQHSIKKLTCIMLLFVFIIMTAYTQPPPKPTLEPTPVPISYSGYYGEMKVLYRCGDPNSSTSQIKPQINIVNTGGETISIGDITVHYYYTKTGIIQEEFNVDYAAMDTSNITGTFNTGYLEIGFTSSAGSLAPGEETGEIHLRISRINQDPYDQTDDYSFDPSKDTYEEWDHILLFLDRELVWGEPTDGISDMNGDVNSDNRIDIIDALLIAQYYVGYSLENFNASVADVNNDDKIDIVDALLIAQYYVGKALP